MGDVKLKWAIKIANMGPGVWSYCAGLSHWGKETYIYLNFYRWTIAIGRLLIYRG